MTAESSALSGNPDVDAVLHGQEFSDEPARVYARLRGNGPVSLVEIAPGVSAYLVTDYETALEVLRDPALFTKDSRVWQETVPSDCPVLPMMEYRENCNFASGGAHARLRGSITDALERVDTAELRQVVERSAGSLINGFAPAGRADLLADYARRLPVMVLAELFGCPPEMTRRLVTSMVSIFDAVDTQQSYMDAIGCVRELVALKRAQPGDDVASRLVRHPEGLTDDELIHQLVMMMGAGCEPQQNLIANSLRLLLVDERFAGDLSWGGLPVDDALDEVLWTDPPLANFCAVYPVRDVRISGVQLRAHTPVLISLAGVNTDPALAAEHRAGNRAHLAWGGGPHACPAHKTSRLIAAAAIETLLDRLPGMTLGTEESEISWRPGPFHRALTALPVRFPPVPVALVDTPGGESWTEPAPTASTSPEPTYTPKEQDSAPKGKRRWWNFLVAWWHGQ